MYFLVALDPGAVPFLVQVRSQEVPVRFVHTGIGQKVVGGHPLAGGNLALALDDRVRLRGHGHHHVQVTAPEAGAVCMPDRDDRLERALDVRLLGHLAHRSVRQVLSCGIKQEGLHVSLVLSLQTSPPSDT